MREICQSGSEGGASQTNGTFLPLSHYMLSGGNSTRATPRVYTGLQAVVVGIGLTLSHVVKCLNVVVSRSVDASTKTAPKNGGCS